MDEVYSFLKEVQTYYIATVEGDQPRVRPFGTIDLFEGKLYIQTGLSKPVAAQIKANPKVELSAFNGEKWLRLSGTLVYDPSEDAQAHMLDNYPQLKSNYAVGDGNNAVYFFKDATATFASFSADPVVYEF